MTWTPGSLCRCRFARLQLRYSKAACDDRTSRPCFLAFGGWHFEGRDRGPKPDSIGYWAMLQFQFP